MKLIKNKSLPDVEVSSAIIEKGCQRSMKECFDVFKILHQVVNSVDTLRVVAESVLKDFQDDNVYYLELRSTPRDNVNTGLTKRSYISTLLDVIQKHNSNVNNTMLVRFLPSIDRGRSVDEAWDTLKVVEEFLDSGLIPGIDFSGNPYSNDGCNYVAPLSYAKKLGLKLSIHMAEVIGKDNEIKAFLTLPPDRIGHGTYLNQNKSFSKIIKESKIPIEVCVTSNIKTKTSPEKVSKHHIGWWINNFKDPAHPCVLCTDDKGVFSVSLSAELQLVSEAFNLSCWEIFQWSKSSIDHIFADDLTKANLKEMFDKFYVKNQIK